VSEPAIRRIARTTGARSRGGRATAGRIAE
jgi:hypothetical protein